jgi:N-acetylmuramoyl-L-alanine amidase
MSDSFTCLLNSAKIVLSIAPVVFVASSAATQENSLKVVYPPNNHETASASIFLIGNAPSQGDVLVNNQKIKRSSQGNFAPSFPLQVGENLFTIRYQNQEIKLKVTRKLDRPEIPTGVAFASNSLTPNTNISRLEGESICFSAIAPPNGKVSVSLDDKIIPLTATPQTADLPPNNAILNAQNQPIEAQIGKYQGCGSFTTIGNLGNPIFRLSLDGKEVSQTSPNTVEILDRDRLDVVEIIADTGVARTGASTDNSRLTPLPKGTKATVTGKEGEWLRLDYGGWLKQQETQTLNENIPPKSIIRSITSRQTSGETEIVFPLQTPVPIGIEQGEKTFTLTLYNTTAQTDTIRLSDDPLIKRLDWQQIDSERIKYTFYLKSERQWGYQVKYAGTSLILSLRHPPQIDKGNQPLKGIKIVLDPGHGGKETGATGPTGYTEKEVNLVVSKLLRSELKKLGATVIMTREVDMDISLDDRVKIINETKPTIALSIHYNALPDGGDAENTKGVSIFWYHPQSHDLAIFLQNYLVKKLNRPDYGSYWNNLALTRPHSAPSLLLELGFLINPVEFEWITNTKEQEKLAKTIADGVVAWLQQE